MLVSVVATFPATAAGPPAQIVISTPSTVISSDGVLQMEATLYDCLLYKYDASDDYSRVDIVGLRIIKKKIF